MLDIKSYVIKWKEALKERISKLMRKPVLVIVQMASNRDVRNKVKDANEVGIDVVVAHFEEDSFETIEQFKNKVTELAMNGADGIIVQLPLPEKFNNVKYLLENVPAHMDVDVDGKMRIGDPEAKITAVSGSGGVGLLTRCALMENTVRSCEWQEEEMRRCKYEFTLREPEQKD